MTTGIGRRTALAVLACAAAAPGRSGRAADLRESPLRIVVPQAAGGAADALVRAVGESAAQILGRTLVVDNRPGGGGVTATLAVAQAAPDGDTLGLVLSAHAINQAMRARMPYDALADFEPVCLAGYAVLALVAHPAVPAQNIAELIAFARRSPVPLQYASLGTASSSHLAGELFNLHSGLTLQHVPYNGSSQIYMALQGGQIHLAFVTMDSALPQVRAGRLKVLGVTNRRRSPALPQVPAIAETLPGFEIIGFLGFVAPAGTPAAVVQKLYRALEQAMASAPLKAQFAQQTMVIAVQGPAQFADFLRAQIAQYAALARRTGIRIE